MIPKRLQENDYRFVLIQHQQKGPFEKEWQATNNYKYDDPKLLDHIKKGGNYGFVCGRDNIIVIDYDDASLIDEIFPSMPATFTVRTGTGKIHQYYKTDNPEGHRVPGKFDWQGKGTQVVSPGSTHPNGNKYTVLDDIPIAFISRDELVEKFIKHLDLKESKKKTHDYGQDTIRDEIKNKLNIIDALNECGIDTTRNPTRCPFHNSQGGKSLSFNAQQGLWNCFGCDAGGDVFSLFMRKNNMNFPYVKRFLAQKLNLSIQYNFKKASQAFEEDFLAMADQFLDIQPLYYDNARIWWAWKPELSCWQMIDETDIMNMIDAQGVADKTYNSIVQGNILRSLQRRSRLRSPKVPPYVHIQFKDSVINVQNQLRYGATPEMFTTNPIPWEMGKAEDTPTMDRLFEEWVGKEYVPTLYEILAFCCVPEYFLQRIFVLVGSGSNGKSTFLNVLRKFLGDENCAASELEDLSKNRFESSKMFKKLCCQMGETSFSKLDNTKRLKSLSGGDLISFEFKGKDPFVAKNYAKIIVSTNTLPITEDNTDGFYRRWIIVDFPNRFTEKRDVFGDIPDDEYRNLALKVRRIANELWKRRSFTNEGDIEERRKRYDERSNPLLGFVKEMAVNDVDSFIFKWSFRESYGEYCKKKGMRVWNDTELSLAMKSMGYEDGRKMDDDGKHYWSWLGIRWRSQADGFSAKNKKMVRN